MSDNRLRDIFVKVTMQLDRRLAEFRGQYDQMTAEEKRQFKNWVDRLADVGGLSSEAVTAFATIRLLVPDGEAVVVTVKAVKAAVAAWEQGNDYTPGAFAEV